MIIDKDLETAPLRDIFEQAKAHLLSQNAKSYCEGDQSSCAYRSADGLKCAVGIFLSDKVALENNNDGVGELLANVGWDIPVKTFNLLKNLQGVHDNRVVENWPILLDHLERNTFGART